MGKDAEKNKFSELRMRAQTLLDQKPEQTDLLQKDVQKLIHELDTYQIELELQNEDLRNTQENLENSHRRYADFYDFAPVAYMTVSDKGLILEANLTAELVRKEVYAKSHFLVRLYPTLGIRVKFRSK